MAFMTCSDALLAVARLHRQLSIKM